MKCEKCGMNEATCHYSSNINGKITEQHLCAECAGETDWVDSMFYRTDMTFGSMVDSMFDSFGGFFGPARRRFSPWGGWGFRMPVPMVPRAALGSMPREMRPETAEAEQPSVEAEAPAAPAADPELSKRREINALREEMREAAEAEDFEKAAEIRDKLRELEK